MKRPFTQADQYTNPDAYTFEQQTARKRRHRRADGTWDIHGLCRNGYHQPHFARHGDFCEMTNCRCYCHHPAEVAAYAAREGQCKVCMGLGRVRYTDTVTDCHLCFGSGYSGGLPATMKRKEAAR